MGEYYTRDFGSVRHKFWPEFMYIGQWPIFHGPVILPYILNICWTNATTWMLVPCDAKTYLIKCMWVSNLHYMVQWFCHLKTIWWINVVLEILIQCDTNIELKLYIGQWPIRHGPVILPYILKTIWWNIGSMWCKDLPHKMHEGQWHTFHGPVILSYILKTIWWINVILGDEDSMWYKHWTETIYVNQWPIFHGPAVLPYILKTIWWDKCHNWNIGSMWCRLTTWNVYGSVTYISWSSDSDVSWRFDGGMLDWRYSVWR